ncbi:sensor histidine kinase [Catenuloplanes japonicus]|uniref:sensor histidine kinase n=1 Tax=Catenuloplanes japonicus TaxID=33876 RepID=UPI000AA888BB|nr:ATP-binding protein [Catenuloplanes japonicus]
MPRSLRTRLVVIFSAGTTVVLLVCLWLVGLVLDDQLSGAVGTDLYDRRDHLITALRDGSPHAVARDSLAQLYAADGTLISGSPALGRNRLLTPALAGAVSADTWLDIELPIGVGRTLVPVSVLAGPVGDGSGNVLAVATDAELIESAIDRQWLVLLLAAPVLIAGLVGAGWLLVRAALRPVEALSQEAAAISSLDSDRRLPLVPGDDELATLGRTLNRMLDRLQMAFARERTFVDDASHELRTPLTVLRGEIELALGALDDRAEVEQSLLAARDQTDRLIRLSEHMLLLARHRAGEIVVDRHPVDLLDLATEEARVLAPAFGIDITASGEPVVVPADADRLRQVLANAAANSAAAGATRLRFIIHKEPAGVRLECADDGPGVPSDVLGGVFERFVRGDAARGTGGSGLGLSIVRAIVTAHDGTVDLRNGPPLDGAVLTVRLRT